MIDPGGLTDPEAVAGASAILVTHEHFDHFSEENLRRAAAADPGLRIFTNRSVAERLTGLGDRLRVVGEGDAFTAAGFDVKVYGAWHAVIHPDIPRVANIGFLVGDTLFHPGDALTVPDRPVGSLLLPVHGPWSATGELIDYVREVSPRQVYGIHDGALNDIGQAMVAGLLGEDGPGVGAPFARLALMESATLA